jgi:hypothetical protein
VLNFSTGSQTANQQSTIAMANGILIAAALCNFATSVVEAQVICEASASCSYVTEYQGALPQTNTIMLPLLATVHLVNVQATTSLLTSAHCATRKATTPLTTA